MRLPRAAILGLAIASAAAGQLAQPVDGVWHLTGHVSATGCAARCVTVRQVVDEDLVVTNGQLSGAEGLAPACGGGVSAQDFDGLATLVPGRRRWLRIRIVDRPRFLQLMRRCVGYRSLRLGRISGRVRVGPDGQRFDEVVRVSGSVAVAGRTATFTAGGRVHAERVGDARAPLAALRPAALARVLDTALGRE